MYEEISILIPRMVNGNSEGVGIVNSLSLRGKVISEAENSRGGGGGRVQTK